MADESEIRREICDIGRRLYAKGFAAANDGNISYRLDEDSVLCTPTQICKGFMCEDDLCVVDYEGRQKRGTRKRTSEVLLHLEVYKADPNVMSVVHCHPPHATAFSVARVDIPTCILPEVTVFLGVVPRAEYETPGGQSFAETVLPFVGQANAVVLSNHGTVSWGNSVEQAYWKTEILDAYCRILLIAAQLGNIERLPLPKQMELLELRKRLGTGEDARITPGDEMYINPDFGTSASAADQHEALAQSIADRVAEILKQRGQA